MERFTMGDPLWETIEDSWWEMDKDSSKGLAEEAQNWTWSLD
jgi:hypothetical protein